MSSRIRVIAAGAVTGLAAIALAVPAAAEDTLPVNENFTVDCFAADGPLPADVNPQVCGRGHWNFFPVANDDVFVEFIASPEHCSDIKAKVYLDNEQEHVVDLKPGASTGEMKFTKRPFPGNTGIFVTAEGIPGGCNTGELALFGGTVKIRS